MWLKSLGAECQCRNRCSLGLDSANFMKKLYLLIVSFFSISFIFADQSSSASSSSSTSAMQGMTVQDSAPIKKSKRKVQVKGNFKGKDPMIAPDPLRDPPPLDGSRLRGN
jgi:hypothetical protein